MKSNRMNGHEGRVRYQKYRSMHLNDYLYSLCLRVPLGNTGYTLFEGGIGAEAIGEGSRYFNSS